MIRAIIFLSILSGMVLGNLFWWRHAHVTARNLRYARVLQVAVGIWGFTMFAVMALLVTSRIARMGLLDWMPRGVLAAVYLWHLLFVLGWVVWRLIRNGVRLTARLVRKPPPIERLPEPLPTRRQFLVGTAVMAPPVIATLAAWRSVSQMNYFRVNTVTLRILNLPPALAGLSIAHVSDIHIGKFTNDAVLKSIVEATNQLNPDLVLFTGDLIDYTLADLPAGLGILRRLNPKIGLCMCEGNHDLFESRRGFERQVEAAGFPLPINSSHHVNVRGQDVQLLGLRWGGADLLDESLAATEELIAESVQTLTAQLRPGSFPIMLAHHPHAFDYIGQANIPLTLAGHTHGGQLNVGPIHPGSLRFRYLSGLYQRGGRQLFVSNGVGNWFPLRIGAPAEIVHLTLQPA